MPPTEPSELARDAMAAFAAPSGSAFLRVVIETHESRLEMDTRCGSAKYIEARAVEAIRAGCVGLLIASPNDQAEARGTAASANQKPL